MGDRSGIEWTDATWNPVRGCSIVSEGCRHCYAMRQARRMDHEGGAYEGLTVSSPTGPKWSGDVRTVPELLDQPLRWTRPRRVFVNSMSDLFHSDVPDDFIYAVFGTMARSPRHVFQILTKRSERMAEFLSNEPDRGWIPKILAALACECPKAYDRPLDKIESVQIAERGWPLPNVWLGTSCEDQATADERISPLLETPAAVRWVSAEPLLGPIDLAAWFPSRPPAYPGFYLEADLAGPYLDWVVAGGESGPGARPMHPDWIRSIRDQCLEADVPFFFKQWGAWVPPGHPEWGFAGDTAGIRSDGSVWEEPPDDDGADYLTVRHAGKKVAGRELDGREWNQQPDAREEGA